MEAVLEKKNERSKAKQAVSICARRLVGAVRREEDSDSLKRLVLDLEHAFDDFYMISEEYEMLVSDDEFKEQRVVNNLDLKSYEELVKNVYEDAMAEFIKIKSARLQNAQEDQVASVKSALSRSIIRIQELIPVIQGSLSTDDAEALSQDESDLDELMDEIWSYRDKLYSFKGEEELMVKQVEEIQRNVCVLKRSMHVNKSTVTLTPIKPKTTTTVSTPMSTYLNQERLSSIMSPSQAFGFPVPFQSSTTMTASNYSLPTPRKPGNYTCVNSGINLLSSSSASPLVSPAQWQTQPVWSTGESYSQVSSSPVVNPRSNSTPPATTSSKLISPSYPQWSHSQNFSTSSAPEVRLKKMSLPTFSGLRKDWPEFKAVWKQLAENAYSNKTALAHELKSCVRGEASLRIKSVYITKPEAYETMWRKLEAYYEDPSASVQAALDDLSKLKPVKEGDYKGLVVLIDEVESAYSQLRELDHLDTLTMRDVDFVSNLLPSHLKCDWIRKYYDMSPAEKIHPFIPFMKFLERERETVSRLAEQSIPKARILEATKNARTHQTEVTPTQKSSKQFYRCAYPAHRKDAVKHSTEECREFQKLMIGGKDGKLEMLKQVNACFLCFGDHKRNMCPNKKACSNCGSDKHHVMLCKSEKQEDAPKTTNQPQVKGGSHVSRRDALALYPIQQVKVCGIDKTVTVFSDSGSNTTYITHKAADKIKAQRLNKYTLDVTTMGDIETTYDTVEYQFTLMTNNGKRVEITAYGMERITGPVSRLDLDTVAELFPEFEGESLQRKSTEVDILLGCDYFGLHPKKEEAACGDNLSVMSGEFGICLQGAHPRLKEETVIDTNLAKVVHSSKIKAGSHHARVQFHEEFQPKLSCGDMDIAVNRETYQNAVKAVQTVRERKGEVQVENFIRGEEFGTETTPRCGGCRCNKCPTVGHTYSFKEEQELKMIRENLEYDEENQRWITSYPWLSDPATLPNNYSSALSTLKSTERTLNKDKQWSETYQQQMKDMVDREVARKLTEEEIRSWQGPVFYISHLAVVNPKSNSTPVRIVFNSSQVVQGVSLNSYLAKGPDSYMNNLLGILLRWREEQVAVVGDIRKMFNSVLLKPLEQHCHRFLWRDLDTKRDPDEYVIQRVNMGDRPAPAISTEALYKTADRFEDESPRAARVLRNSSYVDDLVESFPTKSEALTVAKEVEVMLAKGGFNIKCWQFSGESSARGGQKLQQDEFKMAEKGTGKKSLSLLKGTEENLRVLGTGWNAVNDTIVYEVDLNFSKKKKSQYVTQSLCAADVPKEIPQSLSKRMVLGQVMKIYDPLGLVCPFTLIGKIYLRETWSLNLGWDEPLPKCLRDKWLQFFSDMFQLEQLHLNRCIRPANTIGLPWLVILSDGSDLAYGFAAYARWKLADGSFCCQLIMAKSRIAPMNKLSTPQMELNGAVLSKRGRKVIEKEMRLDFEKVLQLVDSETVLNMINKTSTRFKVYEGVRIGEIQAATEGDVSCWAWMSGKNNTADWLTRGRLPAELDGNSEWWNGPAILSKPIEEWGLKFGLQTEGPLPGEKKLCNTAVTEVSKIQTALVDYKRFSNIERVLRIVARLLGIARHKSFIGGKSTLITAQSLKEAENLVIKDIQKSMHPEMKKTDRKGRKGGRYSRLQPALDEDGFWVVGRRLMKYNAMIADSSLQKLLPTCHPGTRLLMVRAHKRGHRGRDATLALFRQYYWVPHGSSLAKSVRQNCQMCKLRDARFLTQEMGVLPLARLKPAPAFNSVMIDLFGPYTVRGEVQKRISGKAYGVIFTDLTMRAVHIEAVYGYDTSSFLLSLSRFASLRGWPQTIYSDPGSQLVGADRELKEAWKEIDKEKLQRDTADKGLTWVFGPADSPWYQGAVEALVKSAKRAIHFAVHNQRLSVPEFLTLCSEIANLLNERPIGSLPSDESELNILTPNSLILGRATSVNPHGWQPQGSSVVTRYRLIQALTDEFWKKWTEFYAPTLVIQKKWNTMCRNLKPGDIVIVADRNTLRGEYHLAEVKDAFPSADGKVRQVTVRYKTYKVGEKVCHYSGARDIVVSRSVHRLALLVPVDYNPDDAQEEMEKNLKEH